MKVIIKDGVDEDYANYLVIKAYEKIHGEKYNIEKVIVTKRIINFVTNKLATVAQR